MNVNAIANRARRNAGITDGDVTYRCGHTVRYRASSPHGWAMVAGMSAGVDCDQCYTQLLNDAERLAPLLGERQAAFNAAVARRNKRMAELGIDNVIARPVHEEQSAVVLALRLLNESRHAVAILRENCNCPEV